MLNCIKMKILNLSIFNKILLFNIILVVFPLILTVLCTYNKISAISQTEFISFSTESTNQIKNNLTKYLSEMDKTTQIVASSPEIVNALTLPNGDDYEKIVRRKKVNNFLNSLISSHMDNISIIVSGVNGDLFYLGDSYTYKSDNLPSITFNYIDNPYTSVIKENKEHIAFFGLHPCMFISNNKLVYSIVREIRDINSFNLLGYVYLNIDLETFSELLTSVNHDIQILEDNTIIYSTNTDSLLKQADEYLIKDVNSKTEGGNSLNINNTKKFYTYSTIPQTGWKIVLFNSMDTFNAKTQNIMKFLITVLSICLILSIIIAIFISSAITKPIKKLSFLMSNVIEKEDFNVRFDVKYEDEVTKLGNVFNVMLNKISNLTKIVYKSQLVEKDAIIYALQSQINPHFLYNTLQLISDTSEYGTIENIPTMCSSLSSMFRYSIEIKHRYVRLYDEVEHIKNYFYLQSLRYKNKFKFYINIPEEYQNIRVTRFILQPLVENSIQHGIFSKPNIGQINIYSSIKDKHLHIVIEDNGVGIDKNHLKRILEEINSDISSTNLSSKYLALNNVNKRLVLSYGSEYALKINSKVGVGTEITIKIPIDGYKKNNYIEQLDNSIQYF